jgi:predicted Zn-dependent protease
VLKKTILFTLAAFSAVGLNCSALRNINIYSTPEELQLGEALNKEIHQEMKILSDGKITAFLEDRGQKLVQACDRRDITYHFALVNSEEVNAFAIPGGYCYVNLGLFRQSGSEAELISVLAHEINHVVHRHSMKRLTDMQITGTIIDITLGNSVKATVANFFTNTGLLWYSRDAEQEADHDGLLTMYRAGYNPQGMIDMFVKLKANREGPEPARWQNLFSTHPITSDRIENARKLIASLPPKPDLIMNTADWRGIIKYVNEKYPPPKKAEKMEGSKKGE